MKIAQVAPMWNYIPPKKYGGTERIVSFLSDTLVEMGHDVTLFAPGKSTTKAKLIATLPEPLMEKNITWRDMVANAHNTSVAVSMADQFDIIHCHTHLLGAFFARFTNKPVLHTFHTIPPSTDWRWKLFEDYKNSYNPVFISENQKSRSPVNFPNPHVVHNGIDINQFEFNDTPSDYFAWAGLITKVKGLENAIAAANKLGLKLKIAGKIDNDNEINKNYYRQVIKPLINGGIEYVGELSGKDLSDFYKDAKALLYPMTFEEPFGLVLIEAMACGTPVIVYDRGAVREIIIDQTTGLIAKNEEELLQAIKNIDSITRKDCRTHVEQNFTKEIMSGRYLKVYEELIHA
jgi:glycosyltransferase involved in cell wall biosynthesis